MGTMSAFRKRRIPWLAPIMVGLVLVGCDQAEDSPPPQAAESPQRPDWILELPLRDSASDILLDDFDGDGRLDVALTSHGGNLTQIFYQRESRQFEPGPEVDAVGFHPGHLIRLPVGERPTYLMSAEGEGRLLTMVANTDGGLDVVAESHLRFPRVSAHFNWPDWGLGLVAAPFSTPSLIFLKGFDPFKAKAKELQDLVVPVSSTPVESIAVADLDQDGIDEILFAVFHDGTVRVVRYPGPEGEVKIETLPIQTELGAVRHLVAFDINADGPIDLIVPQESAPNYEDPSVIHILVNDGQANFSLYELPFPAPTHTEGGLPGIRALDAALDRDGHRYIFSSGYERFVLHRVPLDGDLSSTSALSWPYKTFREGNSMARLQDLDGDGWLDAIVARGRDIDSGLIIFGPLWEHFGQAAEGRYDLP